MAKTFLIDYDLYLARKYLAAAGKPVQLPQAVPISANAPDEYRVYFAAPGGTIHLGVFAPTAREILFLKLMNEPGGEFFVFVMKGAHLVEVLTPSTQTVVVCLSIFAGRNLLQPGIEQDLRQSMSVWREQLIAQGSTLAGASDEDILDFVYRGSS